VFVHSFVFAYAFVSALKERQFVWFLRQNDETIFETDKK